MYLKLKNILWSEYYTPVMLVCDVEASSVPVEMVQRVHPYCVFWVSNGFWGILCLKQLTSR